MQLQARPSGPLSGRARAPGDKSISHRALILGAMADGVTEIDGLLEGADVLRTAAAIGALGAEMEELGPGRWRVRGQGRLAQPPHTIECGNSGTGVRLLIGAAAGYPIGAAFDGDSSLRKRPMDRIAAPLAAMGAQVESAGGRLPLTIRGGALSGIVHKSPVASAQIKSAVLLAGLNAEGETIVIEPAPSRDHTERMLAAFGADIDVKDGAPRVRRSRLRGTPVRVPADPSSAAFPAVAALIVPGSELRLEGVLLNPLRAGLFQTLREMGADLSVENAREDSGEPVGDLVVRHSKLKGVVVPPERAPSMIDEYPILAVAAACAEGETIMRGIGEMRVKESDRIALMIAGLRACGIDAQEEPEGMIVRGTGARPRGGALVRTEGDHRIAMSHLVLGLAARGPIAIDEAEMIETSFPDFPAFMRKLGAEIE